MTAKCVRPRGWLRIAVNGLVIMIGLPLLAAPAFSTCWSQAALTFAIEARLLQAIAVTESGLDRRSLNLNTNGSHDIGLMQINSRHLPALRKLGIDEQRLYQDTCLSVMVGASILSGMMARYGYNWEAVGAYNAGTAPNRYTLRMVYARRVWLNYQKLPVSP